MIRPIEMQMLLPRTESVGTTQQHENQRVVNENAFAAREVAREVKHQSKTVIKKDANEFAEYHYDAKEEGRGTYQNPRKKRRSGKEEDFGGESELAEKKEADREPRVNIQI